MSKALLVISSTTVTGRLMPKLVVVLARFYNAFYSFCSVFVGSERIWQLIVSRLLPTCPVQQVAASTLTEVAAFPNSEVRSETMCP
jgi:hypothetical protein